MTVNLPVPVTPIATTTRLIPMPIFYGNAPLSLLAVMYFPDDLTLARKLVAHFLSSGTLQSTLGAGVQIDNRYMAAILSDLADGQPDQRLVGRLRYWASACGQVTKALFALINSNDERVRGSASWERAILLAERESGRTIRRSGSSLLHHLRRHRAALHICAAFEMAGEETVHPPKTAEALMLNAMTLYEHLRAWDVVRRRHRSDLLSGDVFWKWQQQSYADHGVRDVGVPFGRLIPHGKGGRPVGS